MAAAQLRHFLLSSASPLAPLRRRASLPLPLPRRPSLPLRSLPLTSSSGGGGGGRVPPGGGGGGGGGNSWGSGENSSPDGDSDASGPLDFLLAGWRARVSADPQFPFKVLMEQLVGVTACVLGDMASRPNFGLDELDFVFSTLVVGSILNFLLMYLLAPTATTSATALSALPSYMFQPGAYSLFSRVGTFVTKGVTFAAVGFGAGIAGTAISNGLMAVRKRMDPGFETPNEPPPTLLNAMTWAAHMGLSSNLRYQTLNGVEFVLEKALPSTGFKTSVVVLRVLNNVLGGVSFVALARLTGSQKAAGKGEVNERLIGDVEVAMKAEVEDEELQRAGTKK